MKKDIYQILSRIEAEKNSGLLYTPSIYSAEGNAQSYYFSNCSDVIVADSSSEIEIALMKLQEKIESGFTCLGFVAYETGYFWEEALHIYLPQRLSVPFLYFIVCEDKDIEVLDSSMIDFDKAKEILKETNKNPIDNFVLSFDKSEYVQAINKIKDYIAAGDTYQVNFTTKGHFDLQVSPKDLFVNLIFSQSSEYSAFINTGEKIIVSNSPEMFFEITGNQITVKPMKGTAPKGNSLLEEMKNIEFLRNDQKNKAENIMIVDLLRNDIGKFCKLTSVNVKDKYTIQSYESLHQMISTVTGTIGELNITEIFKNIFPCGSITGAPKIRTMQIINELEKDERGLYTGALGIVSRQKSLFNVAIRTAVLDSKTGKGEIGVGSGIVWDSIPENEFEETKLKAEYITKIPKYYELIESLLFEDGEYFLLEYHIERLKKAASYFLFQFSEDKLRKQLFSAVQKVDRSKSYKCRVLLDKWGQLEVSVKEIDSENSAGMVYISAKRIDSQNKFQYFKTTNRSFYDSELKKAHLQGFRDVIFLNEKGEVAEGATTNVVVHLDGTRYTPYLQAGLLNGCYRQYLIDRKQLFERRITVEDIVHSDGISLINSVRKSIRIENVFDYSLKKIATFTQSDY